MAKKGSSKSNKSSFWSGYHTGKKSGGSSNINESDYLIATRSASHQGKKFGLSRSEIMKTTVEDYNEMQSNKEFRKDLYSSYTEKNK